MQGLALAALPLELFSSKSNVWHPMRPETKAGNCRIKEVKAKLMYTVACVCLCIRRLVAKCVVLVRPVLKSADKPAEVDLL